MLSTYQPCPLSWYVMFASWDTNNWRNQCSPTCQRVRVFKGRPEITFPRGSGEWLCFWLRRIVGEELFHYSMVVKWNSKLCSVFVSQMFKKSRHFQNPTPPSNDWFLRVLRPTKEQWSKPLWHCICFVRCPEMRRYGGRSLSVKLRSLGGFRWAFSQVVHLASCLQCSVALNLCIEKVGIFRGVTLPTTKNGNPHLESDAILVCKPKSHLNFFSTHPFCLAKLTLGLLFHRKIQPPVPSLTFSQFIDLKERASLRAQQQGKGTPLWPAAVPRDRSASYVWNIDGWAWTPADLI